MMIDYSIKVDFEDKLPAAYKELLREAEENDANGEEFLYLSLVPAIDNGAKTLVANGKLNEVQWDILTRKYKWWD